MIYFGVASLWGFMIGKATILIGMALAGRPLRMDSVVWLMMVPAVALSLIGGAVASVAYRQATKRSR